MGIYPLEGTSGRVYSDDIAQNGIGLASAEELKLRRSDLCDATVAAHTAAGTILHEGKRVRDAEHHVVWGGELDSGKQRASGEVETMVQLSRVTLAACLSEHLDAHFLSSIFVDLGAYDLLRQIQPCPF